MKKLARLWVVHFYYWFEPLILTQDEVRENAEGTKEMLIRPLSRTRMKFRDSRVMLPKLHVSLFSKSPDLAWKPGGGTVHKNPFSPCLAIITSRALQSIYGHRRLNAISCPRKRQSGLVPCGILESKCEI